MLTRERLLPRFNQAEYYLLRLPPRGGNLKKQVKLLKYWLRLLELVPLAPTESHGEV